MFSIFQEWLLIKGGFELSTISEMMSLEDRVSVITGGAGFLGRTMAEALLEVGAKVVLVDRSEEGLGKAKEQLSSFKGRVKVICCDLEEEEELRALPKKAYEQFNAMDILINNAAFVGDANLSGWVGPLDQQTNETWRRALNVNLTAAFSLIRDSKDYLAESSCGSIINVGSIYGMVSPNLDLYEGTHMGSAMAYGASKGGLFQLTRLAATELAPEGTRVNALSPGGIERGQPEKFQERYEKRVPLGRMAKEDDFKGVVVFLASELSAYITGQTIQVDGGFTVW